MIGKTLGPYEILALLGKGGMGEVYRARDPKLERDVAIKVLPAEFAQDEERLLRFRREAKLLASLDHPHIAGIFGFETVELDNGESVHFLVLEHVEGMPLSGRLENGPLPVDEALELCEQIAEGLESAHDKGIVHRDLKPANVMLRPDGTVKILDFGLARAMAEESSTSASAQSPTITADYTQPGVVLGTAAYMSPEQARGRTVDRRTDIWSFGCVLYECLTGKVLFTGESATESMGAVLHKEPEWSLLPPGTPPMVQVLLRRCLAKDRRRRLQSIGDARVELQEAIADPTSSSTGLVAAAPQADGGTGRRARTVGALVLVAGATAAGMLLLRPSPSEPFVQLYSILLPEDLLRDLRPGEGIDFDVSPDGRVLVASAQSEDGVRRLYVREADRPELRVLETPGVPYEPTLSPDGQWVVYHTDSYGYQKISTQGGPPVSLGAHGTPRTSWSEDGWIYFVEGLGDVRLSRIPDRGGEPEVLASGQGVWGEPRVFPGGTVLLSRVRWSGPDELIAAVRPGASEFEPLVQGSSPRWSPTGHLLFVRDGTLMAARFDPVDFELGAAVPLIEGIETSALGAQYVLTSSGTLFHVARGAAAPSDDRSLVHVTMDGEVLPLSAQTGDVVAALASPDGQRIALVSREGRSGPGGSGTGLSVLDGKRDILTRLTSSWGSVLQPRWSPDGDWIYYSTNETGASVALHRIPADGSGPGEPISEGENLVPSSISADGSRLYADRRPIVALSSDIVAVRLEEDFQVDEIVVMPGIQHGGTVSPDGAWLAYVSGEPGSDQTQIYVTAASGGGGRVQVSRDPVPRPHIGRALAWSADGTKLYFNSGPARMVVDVKTRTDAAGTVQATEGVRSAARDLEISAPRKLFDIPDRVLPSFDLMPDGEEFLAISTGDTSSPEPEERYEIHVTLNFSKVLESIGWEGR